MAPSVSALLVRPLVASLPDASARASFWSATDLTPEMLADREARVSPEQFRVAWEEAVRTTGDPHLALRIADATPTGAFGVVEYLCRSAPTLRESLTQWCRFLGLLDDAVEVGLVELGRQSALRLLREGDAPAPRSHELCFAQVVRQIRVMLGADFRPSEVRFTHAAAGAEVGRYEACFGCPVQFRAPHTELIFRPGALDVPLPTADPMLLEVLLPAVEARRDSGPDGLPVTAHVRRVLRSALSTDDAQLDAVARRLGMTGRSLQRRLKEEGTAFATVRDGMRLELADRYLTKEISFAEISFLLGFSEPSAFFRAFKRWTGRTPLERRASLVAAPA